MIELKKIIVVLIFALCYFNFSCKSILVNEFRQNCYSKTVDEKIMQGVVLKNVENEFGNTVFNSEEVDSVEFMFKKKINRAKGCFTFIPFVTNNKGIGLYKIEFSLYKGVDYRGWFYILKFEHGVAACVWNDEYEKEEEQNYSGLDLFLSKHGDEFNDRELKVIVERYKWPIQRSMGRPVFN